MKEKKHYFSLCSLRPGTKSLTKIFAVFSPLKSSVNCLNTKDKIFAPMDDDRVWPSGNEISDNIYVSQCRPLLFDLNGNDLNTLRSVFRN